MKIGPLTEKAKAGVSEDAPRICFEGSIRSGKTFASLVDFLDRGVVHGPAGELAVVGKTERTIIRNLIYPLQSWFGDERIKVNRGTGECLMFGRRVSLIGANNEGAVARIQGGTFAGAYVDETSTVPEAFFDMLDSRLSVPGARVWMTTNPETPAHWLLKSQEGDPAWLAKPSVWIDRDGARHTNKHGLDLVRVSFKLEDNTYLDPAYVERIKKAHSGLWYRRYILGEWCIAAGAIYDEWDPERHVLPAEKIEKLELQRVLAVAIDYGTTNPTAGLLIGVTAEKKPRLVVLAEWAPERATDAGLSKSYEKWQEDLPAAWRDPQWLIVDPSAASFKQQLYEDGHSNVYDADNDVIDGIRVVASLLHVGGLVVSDSCKHLADELPGYCWDPKATARGEDAPIKLNDHFCDALRYGVFTTQGIWGALVPLS